MILYLKEFHIALIEKSTIRNDLSESLGHRLKAEAGGEWERAFGSEGRPRWPRKG